MSPQLGLPWATVMPLIDPFTIFFTEKKMNEDNKLFIHSFPLKQD